MKTEEQYEAHLQRLRQKRNYHSELAAKYAKQMDELESDRQMALTHVGKYVKYKSKASDYIVHYMKVDTLEKIQRGFYLKGTGFYKTCNGIAQSVLIRCYWDDISRIEDITKEEYEAALRETLRNFESYILNELGDKWIDYQPQNVSQ